MKIQFLPALATAAIGSALASDIPPSVPMSGFARYEFNKWLFRSCIGSGKKSVLTPQGQPIIDATDGGLLFKAIQQRWQQSADPQRGIYLEFAGYTENGRVAATRLQRSLGWVGVCAERPTNIPAGARLWAAGNEPSWNFVHDGQRASLRLAEGVLELPARLLQEAGGPSRTQRTPAPVSCASSSRPACAATRCRRRRLAIALSLQQRAGCTQAAGWCADAAQRRRRRGFGGRGRFSMRRPQK